MDTHISNKVRFGILALPLYGVLAVASIALHGPLADAVRDPQGFAQAVTAPNFGTAFLLTLLAQVVDLFAFMALYGCLAQTRRAGLAFAGMLLSIAGAALFLSLTGFLALAAPAIGKLYLQGQTGVIDVAVAGFAGPGALAILSISGVLGTLGAILFAVAIAQTRAAPRWVAVLFGLSIPLLAFAPAFSYPLEFAGGLLALVSGVAIALGVWRADGMTVSATSTARA